MFDTLAGMPAPAYFGFSFIAGLMWYTTVGLQGVRMRGPSKALGMPAILTRDRHPLLYTFTVWWLGLITVLAGGVFLLKLLA